MKKIAIIGHGYVGQAMDRYFQNHYELFIYDPFKPEGAYEHVPGTYRAVTTNKDVINACDFAVVCAPTPMNEDGSCDLSAIHETFSWLKVPVVLIKSTVPPLDLKNIVTEHGDHIAFSPEYIGEGKYFMPFWKYPHATEMKYHDFMVVGAEKVETAQKVIDFFLPVSGPDCRYHKTDIATAGLVKYMENSWGAAKVTFCNEWYDMAQALGVDYQELRELWLLDSRVERMHTAVFSGKRGFGGKCYPKDVNAIVKHLEKVGYEPKLLKQVLASNNEFVNKNT